MFIKLYLFIASFWIADLMAANQKDFRIYQNMTCDMPLEDHAVYWSSPDANRKAYYKRILQAVLMGKAKSSARHDDVLTRGNAMLIMHIERRLQPDLVPALKVLKGAALVGDLKLNKINSTFMQLVKLASHLAMPA